MVTHWQEYSDVVGHARHRHEVCQVRVFPGWRHGDLVHANYSRGAAGLPVAEERVETIEAKFIG